MGPPALAGGPKRVDPLSGVGNWQAASHLLVQCRVRRCQNCSPQVRRSTSEPVLWEEADATYYDEAPSDHWEDEFVVIKALTTNGAKTT